MPDNTNVNNNASVVVVGRTAPVPPGQQKSEKSVPVVIASDQSTIPVAEQNKVASEVALSLLGIPRSEVALGIFADVNTYDVNPTEWAAEPEVFNEVPGSGYYTGIGANMGHGLTHIPAEAGALLEAPVDKTAVLTSKRFFRYQPGRVSAATFGVKTTVMNPSSSDTSVIDTQDIGSTIFNPAIRKYGIFDNFDGYYWETRNNGQGDNFCVVRRTQSLLFNNPVEFSTSGQTADFGATNPEDVLAPRGNESPDDKSGKAAGFGGTSYPVGHDSTPVGFENVGLGSMVIYRDNLMMTHAAMYDPSLLQDDVTVGITSSLNGALTFASNTGMGISISNAVYDIDTGLMTVTCHDAHNYSVGKYVHLSGIGMTCEFSFIDSSGNKQSTIQGNGLKKYPDRTFGYNILQVGASGTTFVVNVGVSTVPTFYHSGGVVLGLSTSQYVSYSKGSNTNELNGLKDGRIYKVNSIEYTYSTGITTVGLKQISEPITSNYRPADTDHSKGILVTDSTEAGHSLTTPVPFVRPVANLVIPNTNVYSATKPSGMFPYMYKDKDGNNPEGYIDTTLSASNTATLEAQISLVNDFYKHWVNQNVKKDFWNVYEYRVPRSRFSGDRLDNLTDNLLYSDVTALNRAGSNVIDPATNTIQTDTSIWNLEFDKVTMYKIEFSWYGAVGALFLAYVPVGAGEARWVRVHHLRASNQLKGSSLGNATLPITYMVYGGGSGNGNANSISPNADNTKFGYSVDKHNETASRIGGFGYGSASQHIVKYGASYYIDGGDRGTVKLFSHGTPTGVPVFGSKRVVSVGSTAGDVNFSNSTATEPYIIAGGSAGISGTSFYVGAKVITGNDLDQNIEITYVNGNNLFLNSPLATVPSGTVTIIANRPTPLVGLKCRDFITSSLGQDVRNRTQVYPTRLSTGSTGMIKIDLLKSPIFQTTSAINSSITLSLNETIDKDIGKRGKSFLINVSNTGYLTSEDTGVYGYFRGKFKNDPANKIITVFGYLERRSASTGTAGYYFRAENSTSDDIELIKNSTFLYEEQSKPTGEGTTPLVNESTLDPLSSIKVSPQVRAPIPKTGTIVASLFIPASGEEFDLSSYFDYNKEYLSFPLTNVVESLFVVGSSEGLFDSGTPIATTNASITWEEQ